MILKLRQIVSRLVRSRVKLTQAVLSRILLCRCTLLAIYLFPVLMANGQFAYTFDLAGNLAAGIQSASGGPSITAQPQLGLISTNHPIAFSVNVSGSGLSFQWYSNGVAITGAKSDSLVFTNLGAGPYTNFTVVVSNITGVVTSSPVAIWADTKRTGMPDWWQTQYFGNLNQSPLDDYDGDGVANIDEYREGTIPNNSSSFNPRLNIQATGGRVLASPDLRYYRLGQTVTLTDIQDSNYKFTLWGGSASGTLASTTLVMTGHKTAIATNGMALPVALDNVGLTWTSGGNGLWYGQAGVSHDGLHAAQSGLITDSQQTWLQAVTTNLTETMKLSFWWSVSAQSPDSLTFAIDGTQRLAITGEAASWQNVLTNLTPGTHTLLWTYTKGASDALTGISFSDSGWVDQVSLNSLVVVIPQPMLKTFVTGTNLVISWSTNSPGFTLVTATNLAPTPVWLTNALPPTILGTNYVVTNGISDSHGFYRLFR